MSKTVSSHCQKYDKTIPKGTVKRINEFCELLQANKVKDSKASFINLPFIVQCMFLENGWSILSHQSRHSAKSVRSAFFLFKLFRGAEMKGKRIYARFTALPKLDAYFKRAKAKQSTFPAVKTTETRRKKPTTVSRARKKYSKEGQRYEAPKSELDPLYLFYTSLYAENPKSALAITWLTEHGVLDGAERSSLVRRYERLKAAGKLVK